MLLVIHNLPISIKYAEIKQLLQAKCGLTQVILDNLATDGNLKKVTVGLADEDDAAILVRKINGLYLQGAQLYVEDLRTKKESEQPFRSSKMILQDLVRNEYSGAKGYQDSLGSRGGNYQDTMTQRGRYQDSVKDRRSELQESMTQWSASYHDPVPQSAGSGNYQDPITQRGASYQDSNQRGFQEAKQGLEGAIGFQDASQIYQSGMMATTDPVAIMNYNMALNNMLFVPAMHVPQTPIGFGVQQPQIPPLMAQRPEVPKQTAYDFERNGAEEGSRWDQDNMGLNRGRPEKRDYLGQSSNFGQRQDRSRWNTQSHEQSNLSSWDQKERSASDNARQRGRNAKIPRLDRLNQEMAFDRPKERQSERDRPRPIDAFGNDSGAPPIRNRPARDEFQRDTRDFSQNSRQPRENWREEPNVPPKRMRNIWDNAPEAKRAAPARPSGRDWNPNAPNRSARDAMPDNGPSIFTRSLWQEPNKTDFAALSEAAADWRRGRRFDIEAPSQGRRPDITPPSQGRRPDITPPSQGRRPDITPASHGRRPDITPTSHARRPDISAPSHGRRPGITTPSRSMPYDAPSSTNRQIRQESTNPNLDPSLEGQRTRRGSRGGVTRQNPPEVLDGKPILTMQQKINRNLTWRGQATSAIFKEMVRNLKVQDQLSAPLIPQLKHSIRSRVNLVLGDRINAQAEEIKTIYRKKFPASGDRKFFDSVVQTSMESKPAEAVESAKDKQDRREMPPPKAPGPKKPIPPKNTNKELTPQELAAKIMAANPTWNTSAGAKKTLPNYQGADKTLYIEMRKLEKMELSEGADIYELPASLKKALDDNADTLCDLFMGECLEPADDEEQVICEQISDVAADEFRKVIRLHVTKRLLKITTGLTVMIHCSGKFRIQTLEEFLKPFGVISLKKSEKAMSKIYIASCADYERYDALCTVGTKTVDECKFTIKPRIPTGQKAAGRSGRKTRIRVTTNDRSDTSLLTPIEGHEAKTDISTENLETVDDNQNDIQIIENTDVIDLDDDEETIVDENQLDDEEYAEEIDELLECEDVIQDCDVDDVDENDLEDY